MSVLSVAFAPIRRPVRGRALGTVQQVPQVLRLRARLAATAQGCSGMQATKAVMTQRTRDGLGAAKGRARMRPGVAACSLPVERDAGNGSSRLLRGLAANSLVRRDAACTGFGLLTACSALLPARPHSRIPSTPLLQQPCSPCSRRLASSGRCPTARCSPRSTSRARGGSSSSTTPSTAAPTPTRTTKLSLCGGFFGPMGVGVGGHVLCRILPD